MNDIMYKTEVFAKVNLSLEITGKRDGLHTLRMLICPCTDFKDVAEFYPQADSDDIVSLDVEASFDGFDKDRFKAFCLPKIQSIAKKFGIGGRLVLKKGVPLGAGLGGSSASVVAALKAMRDYVADLGKNTALDNSFLLQLGSDVPCMLYGKTCLVSGVGEFIKPVEIPFYLSDLKVKIAEGGSDTKACYAEYDRLKSEFGDIDTSICHNVQKPFDVEKFTLEIDGDSIELFKNDLTMPAANLNKNIQILIEKLRAKHKYVFLSGSGSAVAFKTDKMQK